MPEFIPYTERPEFIPRYDNPTFAQSAALFAYGDVDGMLTDLIRRAAYDHHPTTTTAPARDKAAAHG